MTNQNHDPHSSNDSKETLPPDLSVFLEAIALSFEDFLEEINQAIEEVADNLQRELGQEMELFWQDFVAPLIDLEIEWETRLTCEDGQERSQVAQLHSLEMGFINIYPNPSNGLFTLEYLGEENTSYELYNSLGQAIARGNISTGQNQISLSEVSRGTYSIVIKTENSVQNHIIVIK